MSSRTTGLAALCATATLLACSRAPDPLAEFRKTCTDLQAQGQLRAGLSLDECTAQLKSAADATDPKKHAEELADRIQHLAAQNQGKPSEPGDELRQAILLVQGLGRPAAPVLQSRMEGSRDPEVRVAMAKALIGICFDDCAQGKFGCIVPALLEGLSADKPSEVRQASVVGLARCTGKGYGDDPAAWQSWWASVKQPN